MRVRLPLGVVLCAPAIAGTGAAPAAQSVMLRI